MLHHRSTKGELISKVFRNETKQTQIDLDALERQVMMDKEIGNSKTRVHICHMLEIIRRLRLAEAI